MIVVPGQEDSRKVRVGNFVYIRPDNYSDRVGFRKMHDAESTQVANLRFLPPFKYEIVDGIGTGIWYLNEDEIVVPQLFKRYTDKTGRIRQTPIELYGVLAAHEFSEGCAEKELHGKRIVGVPVNRQSSHQKGYAAESRAARELGVVDKWQRFMENLVHET